jgi:hypothetical protein
MLRNERKKAVPQVRHGLPVEWALRSVCGLVLSHLAQFVEAFASALAQNVGCLGAGSSRQLGDLAAVIDALFEHLLSVFGILDDPVLGRDRLGEVAEQYRHVFDRLAGDLDLTPGDRLDAFDGELVGLAQRLDISALTGHQRFDVKRTKAKVGHHLGYVEIEKAGAGIHGWGSIQAGGYCALHNAQNIGVCPAVVKKLFCSAAKLGSRCLPVAA